MERPNRGTGTAGPKRHYSGEGYEDEDEYDERDRYAAGGSREMYRRGGRSRYARGGRYSNY